jgi:flagellar assembly protein FliH
VAPPAKPDPALADAERERIERDAFQRGFSEGKRVGKEQSEADVNPVLDRLSRCMSEISALRTRMRRDAEKDLVKLAIAIARRVLHRELTLDPESIEGLIKVALDRLESRELCKVRVHPDQETAIRTLLDRFSNSRTIEILPDKSLRLGDVLLETEHGSIDASVDAQLNEIERGFADRLRR